MPLPPDRVPEISPDRQADLRRQTEALLNTIEAFGSPDSLNHPSLCAGWTRAHVLTHLARNADGIARLCRAAQGSGETMYAGTAERDADIADGAARGAEDIRDDATQSALAVLDALAELPPDVGDISVERTPGGQRFRARHLPWLRLREVCYHHVDLDAGVSFTDLPGHLVTEFLEDELRRLTRRPEGPPLTVQDDRGARWDIAGGGPTVTGTQGDLLGWLARGIPGGLDLTDAPTLPEGR